jgi:predicted solute-binding protein
MFTFGFDVNYNNILKDKTMAKTITFNELRKIKDQLPSGSMKKIAEKLDLNEETVRNYFGGRNFDLGQSVGIHFEQGPGGGIVTFDDTTILDMAQNMIKD